MAQQNPPEPFTNPLEILMDSIRSMVADLIERAPLLAAGLVAVLVTWIAATLVSRVMPKMLRRTKWRPSLKELMITLMKVVIWVAGLLIAAMILFPGLTPAKALSAAGLASVAVGLAFKDIFQNFFAGILLMWKFPFEPGDFIECGDLTGKVIETELRLTTIRATTGELLVLPNAHLVGNPIQVLTESPLRRVELATGVAYGEDVATSVKTISQAVESCELVDKSKPRDVLVSNFGSSSIDIDVLYWADSSPLEMRKSKAQVITAIKSALDEAGIEIPFPYRTLTFSEPLKVVSETDGEVS